MGYIARTETWSNSTYEVGESSNATGSKLRSSSDVEVGQRNINEDIERIKRMIEGRGP